jgi:hypothetical protein
MPLVSANFNADFSKFADAVEGAQAKMKNFQEDAGKVTTSLSAMENSISGVKIVQAATIATQAIENLGGVSNLTYDELQRLGGMAQQAVEKLNALGKNVPENMQRLADEARGAAEEVLRLQENADKAGNSFGAWVGKLDVKGAITDPLGTAKNAVLDFAKTIGPEGVLVGEVVAAAGVLIKLGDDAEAVGRSIGKMGTMFNIPVGPVSDLRFAITAAGGDFNTFGDSLFMMQKRVEDNADQVKKGVEKIGISFESFKNARPDEQMLMLSDGMREFKDQVNLSAVSSEIWGRQGREMLPLVLKPLRDLTDESQRLGATWADEDVKAAKDFGAATTKLAAETEEAWTSLGRTVAPVTNEIVLAWDQLKLKFAQGAAMPFEGWAKIFDQVKGALGENALADERMNAVLDTSTHLYKEAAAEGLNYAEQTKQVATKMLELGYTQENVARVTGLTIDKVRELSGELKNAQTASDNYNAAWERITALEEQGVASLKGVTQATIDQVIHLQDLHAKQKDIEVATGLSIDQQKLVADGYRASQQEAKKYADAWTELNSLGTSYKDTVAQLNPKLVEQATYYLNAGASVSTLAAAFPELSAAQAKALDEMAKAAKKFQEDYDKNEVTIADNQQKDTEKRNANVIAGFTAIQKAQADLKDVQMKASMDTTSYQVMKVWESADAQVAAFEKAGHSAEQVAQYTAVVWETAATKQDEIQSAAYDHLSNETEKILVDVVAVANKIKGIADDAVAHTKQATAQLETLQGGVKMPGSGIETAFGQQYLIGPNGQRIAIGPHGELPDNLNDLMSGSSFSSGISNQPRIPGFAEGGMGDFGSGTLAMLHGKEAIVPLSGGAVGATTIHVYVTQPLGTASQIADVVGKAIMQNLRGQGMRMPSGG